MRAPLALLFALAQSACAQFPALDATVTEEMKAAPYPALGPISAAALPKAPPPRLSAQTAAELQARSTRLRARAARLTQQALAPSEKARLRATIEIESPNVRP